MISRGKANTSAKLIHFKEHKHTESNTSAAQQHTASSCLSRGRCLPHFMPFPSSPSPSGTADIRKNLPSVLVEHSLPSRSRVVFDFQGRYLFRPANVASGTDESDKQANSTSSVCSVFHHVWRLIQHGATRRHSSQGAHYTVFQQSRFRFRCHTTQDAYSHTRRFQD